jgi:hypothetical protein
MNNNLDYGLTSTKQKPTFVTVDMNSLSTKLKHIYTFAEQSLPANYYIPGPIAAG